ncbi:MAG: HYR domain-containing protein, partial [Cytophagales bacterium]
MKKILLLIALLISFCQSQIFAQGATCNSASPFCVESPITYPAGVSTPDAAVGPNYGCLFTQPNPGWFFMTINTPGTHNILVSSTAGVDVDFAMWGPWPPGTSTAAICADMADGTPAPIGCDYTTAPSATFNFTSTVSGQIYIMLVTNFSNLPTNIDVSQTSGSGTTNCALPPACSLVNTLNANPGTTVCQGSPITFTADPSNVNPAGTLYQFFLNGSPVGPASGTKTYTYVPSNGDNFYVVVSNPAPGCATNTSPTQSIVVRPVNSTMTRSPLGTLCPGTPVTFTIDPSNLNTAPGTNYQFLVNGIPVGPPSGTKTFTTSSLVNGDVVSGLVILPSSAPVVTTFTSSGSTTIPTSGSFAGCPSSLTVSGIVGTPTIEVLINGLSHTFPDDIDLLLRSPSAQNVTLMSDCGAGTDIVGVNYTIADAAGASFSDGAFNPSGGYRPTNYISPDTYCAPVGSLSAPLTPTAATLASITGPYNGTWSLFGQDDASGDGGSMGSWGLRFTVPGLGGCTVSTNTFTMSIVNNPPTFTCPATVVLPLNATCNATIPNLLGALAQNDDCTPAASLVLSQSPAAGTSVSGSGTTNVTITVTDGAGLSTSCIVAVVRQDNTLPVITVCPPNVSINTDASCNIVLPNYVPATTATDNCGVVVTQSPVAGTVINGTGVTVITMTATDPSGNATTCTFNVTRLDVTPPTITCPAAQTIALDASCAGTLADYRTLATGVSDNCTPTASITLTQSPAAGTAVSGTGTTFVTLTATDASGNATSCTFNVNRVDTAPPTITCPATQIIALDATCSGTLGNYIPLAVAGDNCGLVVTQSPVAGTAVSGVGTTVVTLTATDPSGNATSCTFNVNRVDTTPPSITCPAAQTLALNASCSATLGDYTTLATGVSDNCTATAAIVLTQSPVAGTAVSGVGITLVTLTATDASGNTTSCTFNVNRVDNTPPSITCPATQTIVLNATCAGTLGNYIGLATGVSDNCTAPPAIAVTQSPVPSTALSGIGVTVVTLTATDASGNASSCTFNVNRVDNTPPSITCPANISMVVPNAPFVVAYTTPTATDNCGAVPAILTSGLTSGSAFPEGTTLVTYQATDASGNVSTCSFTVTIELLPPPLPPSPAPPVPPCVWVQGLDTATIRVNWCDASANETGYEIYRKKGQHGTYGLIATTGPGINALLFYIDSASGLEPDTRYFYMIITKFGSEKSHPSDDDDDFTYPRRPVAKVLSDACFGTSGQISAVGTHFSGEFYWYESATAETPVLDPTTLRPFTGNVFNTTALFAPKTYWITAKGEGYESKPRLPITVGVVSSPIAKLLTSNKVEYSCGN